MIYKSERVHNTLESKSYLERSPAMDKMFAENESKEALRTALNLMDETGKNHFIVPVRYYPDYDKFVEP